MANYSSSEDYEEKNEKKIISEDYDVVVSPEDTSFGEVEEFAPHQQDLAHKGGFAGVVQRYALKMKMEARGIERVPEDERSDKSVWTPAYFWWATNMVFPPVTIGALGVSVYGLTFWDSVLVQIFFNTLGCIPCAFLAMFAPDYGFRQMIMSRYWFGYHGVKIYAVLNTIACVGWSALNTIVAAEIFSSLNNGALPTWAGMLIVALATLVITVFGYNLIHRYERFCWIPVFAIFMVVIARVKLSGAFTTGTLGTGKLEAGNVLSFGATVFGGATGWAPYACDYCVYQKKNTNKTKLFFVILGALAIPLIFTGILGAAIICTTLTSDDLAARYADNGTGGLLYGLLVPNALNGFGEFCLVILALSTITVNCANIYSLAFSVQTVSHYFAYIPRIVLTVVGTCVFYGISMGAYYNFESYMSNFMNLIGYWVAIYETIIITEHYLFRKSFSNYRIEDIDKPSKLPVGIAGIFAFLCGVAGIVVGMYQTWWTGPLAKDSYADLGFELAIGFSFVGYIITRPFEYKYFKR
ncbi:permease for cytosine/purines, uracil, thiamine, allantoin-domain-containing protein [Dipodascopsis uninucleata]